MRTIYITENTGYISGFSNSEQPNMHAITFEDDGTFDDSFPMWRVSEGTLVKDEANYSAPEEQPTSQEQLNATVLAQIAQNKADQDKFNAQILLQLAKGGN